MLVNSEDQLARTYDVAMLDLDGVVYIGGAAVRGAADHLARAAAAGMTTSFVTNNASRAPHTVAAHLRELGIAAADTDVVTSAQAAAHLLLERHGAGARIVALGGEGLRWALTEVDLVPVGAEDEACAVATGYGPDVRWHDVMQVAVRVRDGLPWVASNTDRTIPTPYGVAPGHGVLVETIERFAGVTAVVAGKPARPLLAETVRRTRARRPLMVGDRLDTDIEAAHNAGVDSLLVLTGVTGLPELVAAPPRQRPTYLAPDLGGLLDPPSTPATGDDGARLGGWTAHVADGRLAVTGAGTVADWWRTVAAAAWSHLDEYGAPPDIEELVVPRTTGDGR